MGDGALPQFVPTEELYFDIDEESQYGRDLAVVLCSMLYITIMQIKQVC